MRARSVLAVLVVVPACAAPESPATVHDVEETTVRVVPNALDLEFGVCVDPATEEVLDCVRPQVNLRVVACSASLSCNRDLLHDPLTFERSPTLMMGFSCGFEDGGMPQDALLSFHPEVRCYTSGDIDDRSTWSPVGGTLMTPDVGEHVFFSSQAAHQGDVYTNSATLLRPLREASATPGPGGDFGFCELQAWGAIAFADMADGTRRAEHVTHSPAVRWHSILQWTGSEWDCHLGEPQYSSLERVVLASATHDQPLPLARQTLPASHALVLVREEPLVGVAGVSVAQPQLAARLRFNEASLFPVEPDDPPEPMTERQLWVRTPSLPNVPVDMRIEATCAQIGASGVEAIGLRVADGNHVELGVVVVWPRNAALNAWDCDRDVGGACELLALPNQWESIVPCLKPAVP